MNGVLNTGLEFWQLVVATVLVILGIITIRITFKFDVNKFLESRRNSYIAKLQNACTHMIIVNGENGSPALQSQFISPPGTLQWHCERCGAVTHTPGGDFDRKAAYYEKNLEVYKKANKKFKKLLKKAGMT